MVKPAEKTPAETLWLSGIDQMMNLATHAVHFYRPKGESNFFDPAILKEALSKTLVSFYPMAGRLSRDHNNRIEVNCNAEGVLFVEADTNSAIEDLGDFCPSPELDKLVSTVDRSGGLSSYPLLALQVTFFKCGGVSVGVSIDHYLADGDSTLHFMNIWSDVARGLDITLPPFLDRSLLRPRNPPQPVFPHVEYQLSSIGDGTQKSTKSQHDTKTLKATIFKMSREQLNVLKDKSKDQNGSSIDYTTFEVLAAHIWRCSCKARKAQSDQETQLVFPVNGRYSRLKPSLPPGFFGNVIFPTMAIDVAGEILSKPLSYAANRVRETLKRIDDNFLRSSIDYLELHLDRLVARGNDALSLTSFNLTITSWVGLPIYEADFGWGKPFYMGPSAIFYEGKAYIIPNSTQDGNLSVAILLQPDQVKEFEKLFYDFLG
ncbi:hypothetical protein UlMin_033570 [Ulmus minor]